MLRVALPDRPGTLGAVATAMGTVGADINAVEIVEKYEGYALDDFMLELPGGVQPDSLVTACTSVQGVEVLWLSRYPEPWGLQGDVDVLNHMTEYPERAEEILTLESPEVFRVSWAVLIDRVRSQVLARTDLAPDLTAEGIAALGPLDELRSDELPDGWLNGWSETLIAVAPFRSDASIVIARRGGPEFLQSELARLRHLAALAL
ncbi:MAG: amino acid-binding protein [Propionicimonas sp.]|uniref:amino acid-binding protein n=1 Tax=Propionicimonas sp. TaxID=1955623 RepID=UPI002B212357|nr:amino acid-binding protein [Propionicimonas sp.]MEA4943185.1 amino acid-binding protein [Propionicimonas sp.]MEA5055756.1 amino acid-binding protein [Propionicimonas sp.]MEA5118528.1 amino acid-binding protein [Propionicimonas sp.]